MDDQMQTQQPTDPMDGQNPMGDASAPVAMPTEAPVDNAPAMPEAPAAPTMGDASAPVAMPTEAPVDNAPAMPEAPAAPTMGDASAPVDDTTQNPTV